MTCIVLKGGVSIDADVWRFALGLEAKGVTLSVDDEGRLLAGPRDRLTPDDVQAIQAARFELKRLVQYSPPPMEMM